MPVNNQSNNQFEAITGPAGTITFGGGGFIPVNNDPNVIGSSTYDPFAGLYTAGSTSGGGSGLGGSGGYWWEDPSFGSDGGGYIYNGGYGAGAGLGGFGGSGSGGSSASLTPLLTGLGGLALGSSLSRGNASAVQRNLPAEVAGLSALAPGLAGSTVGTQLQLSPLLTQLNTANFGAALGNIAPQLRAGWNAANPGIVAQNDALGATLDRLNGQGAARFDPTGYAAVTSAQFMLDPAAQAQTERAGFTGAGFTSAGPAAQAGYTPAQAFLASQERATAAQAAQQRAQGGPLLATLQQQAMQSVGGVSPLQQRQQQIALGLLGGSGGDLSAQDLRNVQQDTRGAFAARGLYDSNQAIGAEIMNSDAARRNRLMQNLGIAQQVDAAGQQQIGATRNFALGVQNQGQNLSQFNAAQGNALGQFNVGQANQIAALNANNANDISKFNAATQTQNSQFNSNLGAQVGLANMAAKNQMAQFDASGRNQNAQWNSGQANALGQFNAQLGTSNNQWNAGARNAQNLAFGQMVQNNNQSNAAALNAGQAFSANAINAANQWNAAAQQQNQNDQWARALGLGNFQMQQAINPTATAMGLLGQAPDYTQALLGYGSDLYGSNANAQSAANISRANNNAALTAAGINLLYNLYGRG